MQASGGTFMNDDIVSFYPVMSQICYEKMYMSVRRMSGRIHIIPQHPTTLKALLVTESNDIIHICTCLRQDN